MHISILHASRRYIRTEITALNHEALDDTVKLGSLVAKVFGERSPVLLDTSGKSAEVLYGLRDSLTGPMLVHTGSRFM